MQGCVKAGHPPIPLPPAASCNATAPTPSASSTCGPPPTASQGSGNPAGRAAGCRGSTGPFRPRLRTSEPLARALLRCTCTIKPFGVLQGQGPRMHDHSGPAAVPARGPAHRSLPQCSTAGSPGQRRASLLMHRNLTPLTSSTHAAGSDRSWQPSTGAAPPPAVALHSAPLVGAGVALHAPSILAHRNETGRKCNRGASRASRQPPGQQVASFS